MNLIYYSPPVLRVKDRALDCYLTVLNLMSLRIHICSGIVLKDGRHGRS